MGLDMYSTLICGVKLDFCSEDQQVTRYNEQTGEPYQKLIKHQYFKIRDSDIIPGILVSEDSISDDVICSNYEDKNSWFLGKRITTTNSNRSNDDLWKRIENIDICINECREMLQKKYGYTGSIELFLVTILSY